MSPLTPGMQPPSEQDQTIFASLQNGIPFNAPYKVEDGQIQLSILERDPQPVKDELGRQKADGWRVNFQCEVLPGWANFVNSMHGAVTAWLVDTCTSAALIALHTPTFWAPPLLGGVTIGLDIQYYHAAPVGTELIVKVTVVKITPTIAQVNGEIVDRKNGKVYASATHLKTWKALGMDKAKL